MGLNAKEIPYYFLRIIQVSIEASFTFIKRHPLISGVLLISCNLYLFLSCIYHFVVYLSPFLVCVAICVRIFWSSEEGQLSYFKKDEKKEELKEIEKQLYKLPSHGERDILLERRYSSINATNRRRNFTDTKFDEQDAVVEAKAKISSTEESCDSKKKDAESSEIEENSFNFAEKLQNTDTQISPLKSEASISEPVKASDSDQQNNKSDSRTSEEQKNSSDYAVKSQNTNALVSPSESEPSISDQVKAYDSGQQNNKLDSCSDKPDLEKEDTTEAKEKKEGEGEDDREGEESQDEEESQEETNKAVEWSEDDQKNLMDLGLSEMERNRRLESLIARRRARQQMKLQVEQGLTDFRACTSRMAPLNIAKTDPLKSPRNYGGIDGLEIPGSAPSALRPSRNPFDLPYDACEERPNLRGGSFCQEFTLKDMAFRRHESFSYGDSLQFDDESNPFFINGRRILDRFRRLPDEGNHELIIEKLFSKSSDTGVNISTRVKAPKPLLVKFEETPAQENKARSKWKKLLHATQSPKSFSHHTTEPSRFIENNNHGFGETHHNISNKDKFGISSEKPEEEEEESKTPTHHHRPNNKKFLNFPIAIFEAPLDSPSSATSRNQEEDTPFPEGCIFHKPTCSIASDLQVEFSEIGSPTALTTDGESEVFDGDIDKEEPDLTPGNDDLGPISIKLRSCEEGTAEMNNDSPKSSPIPLRQKLVEDMEDVIDVSSLSSTSDLHGDSPSHAKTNYDYNIFSVMRKDKVETQASLAPNLLIGLDHPPHETQLQKLKERQILSETEAQVVDHHHVSSSSSTSDSHGDSPTHEKINYDYNVFGDVKKDEVETQATMPSNSSHFLIRRSVDYPPHESQSEKPEERQNLSENSETEAQILDHHVTNSPNTGGDNSNSNEDLRPPVVHQHQESIDAISMKTFSSLSPRSLSPEKILMDQVSSSAFNQQNYTDVPQLKIEDMTQEPPTSELPSNTMPPIIQLLSIDPVALTHTSVSSDFQEPTCSSTMADDGNTIDKSGKLISDDEDRKETDIEVISRNMDPAEGKSEDKSTSLVRQDDSIQSRTSPQMKTLEETNNKSEAVEDDEVTSISPKVTENVGISTIIEEGQKAEEFTQLSDVDPLKPNKPTSSLEEVSDMHGEPKKDNNEEEIKRELKDEIPPKPSLLVDISEEKNNAHSEPMKNDSEISVKLKNYIPENPGEINDIPEDVSKVQNEPKQNDPEMSYKAEVNGLLNKDTSEKSDKKNDSSGEVSKAQIEPNGSFEKVSDVTSSSSVEDTEATNNGSLNKNQTKKKSWFFKFNKK